MAAGAVRASLAGVIVVVSSPGSLPLEAAHWSAGFAAELAREAAAMDHDVAWLRPLWSRQRDVVAVGERVTIESFRLRSAPLPAVARSLSSTALERSLTHRLREHPGAPVVHLGVGAGASPNVAWLADRLGSPVVVVADPGELLCRRGDLVDRTGARCARFDDRVRCRWCCSGWLRRARVPELQNRADAVYSSLAVAAAVMLWPAEAPELAAAACEGLVADRCQVLPSLAPEARRAVLARVLGLCRGGADDAASRRQRL